MKVSIIISAYHAADFITTCLDSCINQHLPDGWDMEIIVGVDGCPDTLQVACKIKNPTVTILEMDQNYGTYITANTMIQYASGNIISRVDADDTLHPNRLYQCITHMMEHPEIGMINTFYEDYSADFTDLIKSQQEAADGVWIFRREVLDKAGGYMSWRCGADSELLSRLRAWKIPEHVIKEPLYMRRCHKQSLTTQGETRNGSPLRAKYREIILSDRARYAAGEEPQPIIPAMGVIKSIFHKGEIVHESSD